ncbi:MAG: hypothetical protein DWQ35_04550 [Planctomycetota bacterium]|nr:MAG: hypothetical protein DWQ35_04550 [Planctomycetota bacterium]REK25114.1 MAG: hypothetical protein DWQ42_12140 [Planctomycetota bacterium]REK44682.1 MAG: hypothetical protein DWQ46_08905 [Planctomycetota bacterium]
MTSEIQNILQAFDSMADDDKRLLAAEILRRSATFDPLPIDDDQLVEAADELFQQLDRDEAADA